MKVIVILLTMLFWLDEAAAQTPGSCPPGSAKGVLHANNVRAAIYNNGNLFWKGGDPLYRVGGANSIFSTAVWVGGLVDGELRFAGTPFGPFDFHAGPLTDDGELPDPHDCSAYDRIFRITALDLARLDSTGVASDDILDWPWQAGATVLDGDGNSDNYDLSAGDRPEITGHEMLWWVMNDVGGSDGWSQTLPLGVEIQASAFAVSSTDPALQNTTFYRYEIVNRQSFAIDSVYVGWMVDADIGNATDDYVGSDTTLVMGFFYNADNNDDGDRGYGDDPPALGVDFLKGTLADSDGKDNDRDGVVDEADERRGMSVLLAHQNDRTPQGNPETAEEAFGYLRGFWRDGRPITLGGSGYGGDLPTRFMFPGDPVTSEFWSEFNPDGSLFMMPGDRRFVSSSGPFELGAGDSEEIVIAVVWARGADRLDSITELRKSDRRVQSSWDSATLGSEQIPPPFSAPPEPASPADNVDSQPTNVTLRWNELEYATQYVVHLSETPAFDGASRRTYTSSNLSLRVDSLQPHTDYYWRVGAESPLYASPFSEARRFRTSDARHEMVGVQLIPGTNEPAFLEVAGPGGLDPCGPAAQSTFGCAAAGGNSVFASYNSTGEFAMSHARAGTEVTLPAFAPNDFDIRFTAEGSFALHLFTSDRVIRVPFEIWDVGSVELFGENDPNDDVQMIPVLLSEAEIECVFGYSEGENPFGFGWGTTARIYAYYPVTSYSDWESAVQSGVDGDPDQCFEGGDNLHDMLDIERGRPIQRVRFHGDPDVADAPGEGTVIRFYTSPNPTIPPTLASPGSGSGPLEQPLTLYWDAHTGPFVRYAVQLSRTMAFDDLVRSDTTSAPSLGISGLDEGATYHWRVRLANPEGPWSNASSFIAGEVTNVTMEPPAELPKILTLQQNYPNPFNPSTSIRFGLPNAQPVKLVVYDLLGRRIATLIDGTMPAGWHDVSWNASNHASGIYLYTIETDGQRRTETMVLLR